MNKEDLERNESQRKVDWSIETDIQGKDIRFRTPPPPPPKDKNVDN